MADESLQFEDVPAEHQAQRHICAIVDAGIISPLSMNPPRFGPEYAVTRAQSAVYLARAMGLPPQEATEPTFADLPKSHWAYGFVEALYARGVVSGTDDEPSQFLPDEAVTRAVIAAALCRAKGLDQLMREQPTFADVPHEHRAHGWVERLVDRDSWGGVLISGGWNPGPPPTFAPDHPVTRASLAILLCRAFGILTE